MIGEALNIVVVQTVLPGGELVFMLTHDYDTDIFTDLPGDGPFLTLDLAHSASDRLAEALSCIND